MKRCSSDGRHVPFADRLYLLRTIDTWRRWQSLDDERVCLLCQRRFAGRHLDFVRNDSGGVELRCPTADCAATPHEWVYLNDPRLAGPTDKQPTPFFGLRLKPDPA
ncbi:MAG: hypothetical protein ACJ8M4_11965 [Chthoniobacterales bacterium]